MESIYRISHNINSAPMTFAFHSHDFWELYFYVSGNVTYYIENETYYLSKGDILIIPPGKLHRAIIKDNSTYDRYVLWIYSDCIVENEGIRTLAETVETLINEKNTRLVSFGGHDLVLLRELFDKLDGTFVNRDEFFRYTGESCIALILGEIRKALFAAPKKGKEQGELISRVIARINSDIADAPSLDELAAEIHLSKYYLSHKFKEYTGTTVHQYILAKKINTAKELLGKGMSTGEVCERCGFGTYANFYKAFVNMTGEPPSAFKVR